MGCRGWSRGTNIHPDVELLQRRRHKGMEEGEVRDESREEGKGALGVWGAGGWGKGATLGKGFLPRAAHISSEPLGCGSLLPAQSHPSRASIPLPGH